MSERLPTYGGQAVMEGVMMRGKQAVAIAMRAPNKEIIIHKEKLGEIYRSRINKVPFLRGLILLWDALSLGMRAITISANVQTGEDEKLEGPILYITVGLSLVIGIGLFFLLPAGLGQLFEHFLIKSSGMQSGQNLAWSAWWGNLLEGLARLGLLIGYIWAIGKIPDIRRVFAYHGAEHKTINAFESRAELTPESVARFPLEHPRCGTSFLLTLILLSILVFTLLGPLPLVWRLVSRILLIPVLAMIAYEYIRWTSRHLDSAFVRWIIRPNLALQHLTTREPSLDMLEVAIAAFQNMVVEEELQVVA